MILRILERFREKQDAAGGLDVDRPRKTGGGIDASGSVVVFLYHQGDFATADVPCFLFNGR